MTPARKATIFLLSTTVIWGSSFFAMKKGTQGVVEAAGQDAQWAAPFLVSLIRFGVAALAFAVIAPRYVARAFRREEFRNSFWIALLGFGGIIVHGWGLRVGSSTIISFLGNLTVITTPIFAILFFAEKISRALVVGAVLATAGAWVLTDPSGGGFGWPEACGLAGAVFFGLQIQLIGELTRGRDATAMTFGMFVHFLWLNALGLALTPGGPGYLRADVLLQPETLKAGLYLGLLGSLLSMWVFMRWQREIPAWRAAIIYCLEPVFAALIGWTWDGEIVTWRLYAGGGLIVVANLVPELLKPRAPAAPPVAAA